MTSTPRDWPEAGYDVVLVAAREDPLLVARRLAERFGISEEEAISVVGQAPVTVKRGVDRNVARELEAHLLEVGAEVAVRVTGAAEVGLPERPAPPEEPQGPRRSVLRLSPLVGLAVLGVAVVALCALTRVPTRGGLRVRTVGGGGRGAPALVLLHGYGAPGRDLVGLARDLRGEGLPSQVRVLVPEGTAHAGLGRAWWVDPRSPTRGFPEARRRVFALIGELLEEGTPPEHVVIGGFSQGGSLAAHVGVEHDPPLGGAAVLSGGGVSGFGLQVDASSREVPYFIAHGRSDPVLDFGEAELLAMELRRAGHEVELHAFDGGHTIVPSVRSALAAFVARVIEGPAAGD